MKGCIKLCVVMLVQSIIIVLVYALVLSRYFQTKPSWVENNLAPLYGVLAALAGIILFVVLKIIFNYIFNRETIWRPSVILYIVLCAVPCSAILLSKHLKTESEDHHSEIVKLVGVFQAIIAGLLFTEWIAKFRMEKMTYTLLEDAAVDFFFAYDVYDFYDRYLEKPSIRDQRVWLIVTAVFATLAMVKYFPKRPIDMEDPCSFKHAWMFICFGMFFNDIPFVIIRFTSLGLYGLEAIDIIHPLKNLVLIIIGCLQIWQLYKNQRDSDAVCIRRCGRDNILHPL